MRILGTLLIAVICSTHLFGQELKPSTNPLIQALDKKVPELMLEQKVPGMALAVFDNNKLIHTKGYGFSNIGKDLPITASTGFNIASISKLFTAFAIMKLVEEGKIDLDAPASTYLTRWKLPKSNYDHNKVTIRHLLSHTAGISIHGYPGFDKKKELPSIEASLKGHIGPSQTNKKVDIILEPQTQFKYSGGGYTILQLVIEEVTQLSFETYMDSAIFQPLGMTHTSFKITKGLLKRSATPYDDNHNTVPFVYFTAKAAAGLQTTLNDFITFTNEILNNHTLVSKKMMDIMTTASPLTKGGMKYGLGVKILQLGPIQLKGHSGTNSGWQSAYFIDFKNKNGLIMLTNGDNGDVVLKNTLRFWARSKYQKPKK